METVLSVPVVRERAPPKREEDASLLEMEMLLREKDCVVESDEKKRHRLFPVPLIPFNSESEMDSDPEDEEE
jgi:hypothetical protein